MIAYLQLSLKYKSALIEDEDWPDS